MTEEKQKIVIVIVAGASWVINNAVKEIYIPHDEFVVIKPSQRKGVYDALMYDFKLGFWFNFKAVF